MEKSYGDMEVVKSVEIVTLIEIKAVKGEGTKIDPVRIVTQYWDFNGRLVFEKE